MAFKIEPRDDLMPIFDHDHDPGNGSHIFPSLFSATSPGRIDEDTSSLDSRKIPGHRHPEAHALTPSLPAIHFNIEEIERKAPSPTEELHQPVELTTPNLTTNQSPMKISTIVHGSSSNEGVEGCKYQSPSLLCMFLFIKEAIARDV